MCTRTFESLNQADLSLIQKRMLPGAMSESGFLQPTENLMDVYGNDYSYLQKVGITYDQIADVLTTLVAKVRRKQHLWSKNTSNNIWLKELIWRVDNRYEVSITTYRGLRNVPSKIPMIQGIMAIVMEIRMLRLKTPKLARNWNSIP
jgi:hypothetical protein